MKNSLFAMSIVCGLLLVLVDVCPGQVQPLPEPLVNYDPSKLVRFATIEAAEKRRQELIRFIWPKGIPRTSLPKSTREVDQTVFQNELSGVNQRLAKSVDRLDCEIDPYDFHAICFLIQPANLTGNQRRLVIVHSGHRQGIVLGEGVNRTIDRLLEKGFQVLVVDMPLVGWNQDKTLRLPGSGKIVTVARKGTSGHNDLFKKLTPPVLPNGTVFRFFVEPVIQGINHFQKTTVDAGDVSMVGLSGGGWATHFCAAVDLRIQNSFPVAGAMPLYARKFSPGSWGDSEQFYEPVYREIDSDKDGIFDTAAGVASWLEIFALGGLGKDRRQIQILNLNDPCCFSTRVYETYAPFVSERVAQLNEGKWSVHSDRTHNKHIISEDVIEKVLLPALKK